MTISKNGLVGGPNLYHAREFRVVEPLVEAANREGFKCRHGYLSCEKCKPKCDRKLKYKEPPKKGTTLEEKLLKLKNSKSVTLPPGTLVRHRSGHRDEYYPVVEDMGAKVKVDTGKEPFDVWYKHNTVLKEPLPVSTPASTDTPPTKPYLVEGSLVRHDSLYHRGKIVQKLTKFQYLVLVEARFNEKYDEDFYSCWNVDWISEVYSGEPS